MSLWLLTLIKSVVLLFVVVTTFAYAMLAERKILGWMQLRPGPNRVGPWGLLQPAADAAKLILKEDLTPETADRLLYKLAPFISLVTAFSVYAVIPFGASRSGETWAIGNVNAGILFILAITSLGVYGICLGGWASGSKYPLLGSVRSTAQMISYELAMSLSLIGVLILAGTTSLDGIVNAQVRWWFFLPQFLGCHHLHHHGGRRNQSRALRPRRSRDRARRRIPHGVLRAALRALLHRRVREHAHGLVHRDAALLRRLERSVRPGPSFRRWLGSSSRLRASCSSICGCARRCRACATTA